jgi:sugar phosphate permease
MRKLFERMMSNAAYIFFWVAVVALVCSLLVGLFSTGLNGLNRHGPFLIFTAVIAALLTAALPFGFAALLYRIDRWLERQK